jgi:hypothetical protein
VRSFRVCLASASKANKAAASSSPFSGKVAPWECGERGGVAAGEFCVVVYRGVGAVWGMSTVGCKPR